MERGALTLPELAACGRRNVVFTYVELARVIDGARIERDYGFTACTAPIDLSFCNFAIDFDFEGLDPDLSLRRLANLAHGRPMFRAFHIPVRDDDPTSALLAAAGWGCQHALVQMAWEPEPTTSPIQLTTCESPEDRSGTAEFMVEQFFWRQSTGMRRHILISTVASCHAIYRLGDAHHPKGAVMTTRRPDSLGLYNLCVKRNVRGTGIGSSIVRAVQAMAATEGLPVVLQCEPGLATWYENLAFKKTGFIESYALIR